MPNLDGKHLDEQSQGLARAAGLIGLVFVFGVLGYMYVGGDQCGFLDAVYMTMITLTTVGYGEVIDLSANPGGRVFTAALLVVGVGSFVYFFSNLTAFMVEGNLDRILWRRRMHRLLNALEHHYIVCGAGRTGRHMIRELRLVSELIRPDAVSFLDTMLRDKEKRLRIEEVALNDESSAVGRTAGDLRRDAIEGLLIIAVRAQDTDSWTFNPADDHALVSGHAIVFMSSPEARLAAQRRWG